MYDGLGSVRALTNSAGSLTDTYDYGAFGTLLNRTGTTETHYLFTGEQYDPTLNQYYLRARYYDQGLGRFTQQDTWMGSNHDPVTLHKYLYANTDPVNFIDPTGNFSLSSFSAASTIQAALATSAIVATYQIGQSFADVGAWDDDDWLAPNVTGWLVLAAMVGSSSSLLSIISEKINEDDSNSYVYYHGTDASTAAYLASGGDIDAAAISENRQWTASSGGFYLADNYDDAFWFGQFHADVGFAIVEYVMTPSAFRTLDSLGTRVVPIPPAPNFFPVGNQMIVPVQAFPIFNQLKNSGQIIPSIAPF